MRVYHDRHGRYRGFSYGPVGLLAWLFLALCAVGFAVAYWPVALALVVLWLAFVGWRAQHRA